MNFKFYTYAGNELQKTKSQTVNENNCIETKLKMIKMLIKL